MVNTFNDYMAIYRKAAIHWWDHIGPKEYLTLLIVIGVLGYLLMLKGPKRLA